MRGVEERAVRFGGSEPREGDICFRVCVGEAFVSRTLIDVLFLKID